MNPERQPRIFIVSEDLHITELGVYDDNKFITTVNRGYVSPALRELCPNHSPAAPMVRLWRPDRYESIDFLTTSPENDIKYSVRRTKKFRDANIFGTVKEHGSAVDSYERGKILFSRHLYMIDRYDVTDELELVELEQKQDSVLETLNKTKFFDRYNGNEETTKNVKLTDVMKKWAGKNPPEMKWIPTIPEPKKKLNPISERVRGIFS